MKLYSCKVILNKDERFQVRKDMVTATEIELMRRIHGMTDAVREIEEIGEVKRTDAAERDRLEKLYKTKLSDGRDLMVELFGHSSLPLPKEVVEHKPVVIDTEEHNEVKEEVVLYEKPKKAAKKAAEKAEEAPKQKLELKRPDGTTASIMG